MPFINMKTNVSTDWNQKESLKKEFGQAITAIPGKSESWLMVGIEDGYNLWFKGTADPAAMVEVSVFGSENPSAFNVLTRKLCDIISQQLEIDKSRIYVSYMATGNWGWNGSNL